MASRKLRLADLLARRSYKEGDFQLSSGVASTFYLDAKQVTYNPDGVRNVGHSVLDLIRPFDVQGVGGLTMGADAIVSSVIWASLELGSPMPGFVVRKEAKEHGLQKWIEGIAPRGRIAIVDDVITSGNSVLRAVDRAQEAGAQVEVVVALVDRQEGGQATIEDRGIPFKAVCTLADIRVAFDRLGPKVSVP